MHHVAVGDHIVLAFEPHLAGIARAGLAAERHIVVVGDGLGADEAALEVGVDDAGRLRRAGAARHGPGPRLLRTGGEIGDEVEQRVAGADQPVEAGLGEADRGEILGALLARAARRSPPRSWPRSRPQPAPSCLGALLDLARVVVAGRRRRLVDVAHVEHRHRGQQAERWNSLLLLRLALDHARRLAVAQQHQRAVDEIERLPCASLSLPLAFFSSASTRRSRLSRSASISSVSMVSMSAIGSMRFSTWVTSSSSKQRTTCAIASTSRILARNWLPSPSPLRGAAHQAGDVDEGEPRRHDLDRLGELRQRVEPRIRHRDLADIRLDGAERIVRRLRRRGLGQRVEERRLADIRQADDAAFEAHLRLSWIVFRRLRSGRSSAPSAPCRRRSPWPHSAR